MSGAAAHRCEQVKRALLATLACLPLLACSPGVERAEDGPRRIVSLDYCADQYVLKFANREDILALSPDAEKRFSYLRAEAAGVPRVRPRTADVLALRPDLVVRSYGGGPGVEAFLERAGVPVVQLGYPETLAQVREEVVRVGTELGQPREAKALAVEMDRRLAALRQTAAAGRRVLYMTSGGATAGADTLVHELIEAAGQANFQEEPGWHSVPLERLAYERPDVVAFASFNGADSWSAAHHPIAEAQLREVPVVPLESAWTSCGGWFLLDAVEALARAGAGE